MKRVGNNMLHENNPEYKCSIYEGVEMVLYDKCGLQLPEEDAFRDGDINAGFTYTCDVYGPGYDRPYIMTH